MGANKVVLFRTSQVSQQNRTQKVNSVPFNSTLLTLNIRDKEASMCKLVTLTERHIISTPAILYYREPYRACYGTEELLQYSLIHVSMLKSSMDHS